MCGGDCTYATYAAYDAIMCGPMAASAAFWRAEYAAPSASGVIVVIICCAYIACVAIPSSAIARSSPPAPSRAAAGPRRAGKAVARDERGA